MLSINFSLSIKTYRRRGRTQCICQSPITQTSHKDERLNYHALAPSLLQAHTHTHTITQAFKRRRLATQTHPICMQFTNIFGRKFSLLYV